MTDQEIETHMPALAQAAREAARHAYARYSQFRVAAAALDADGRVFTGVNVENASLGLSMCAERNAIFQLVAAGSRAVVAIAVYTPTPSPSTPCGACRQVIHEFGTRCRILCVCDGTERIDAHLDALLPWAFGM